MSKRVYTSATSAHRRRTSWRLTRLGRGNAIDRLVRLLSSLCNLSASSSSCLSNALLALYFSEECVDATMRLPLSYRNKSWAAGACFGIAFGVLADWTGVRFLSFARSISLVSAVNPTKIKHERHMTETGIFRSLIINSRFLNHQVKLICLQDGISYITASLGNNIVNKITRPTVKPVTCGHLSSNSMELRSTDRRNKLLLSTVVTLRYHSVCWRIHTADLVTFITKIYSFYCLPPWWRHTNKWRPHSSSGLPRCLPRNKIDWLLNITFIYILHLLGCVYCVSSTRGVGTLSRTRNAYAYDDRHFYCMHYLT